MQSVSLEEPRVVEPLLAAVAAAAAAAAAGLNAVNPGDSVPPQVHGGQQPRAAAGSRVVVLPGPRYIAQLHRLRHGVPGTVASKFKLAILIPKTICIFRGKT